MLSVQVSAPLVCSYPALKKLSDIQGTSPPLSYTSSRRERRTMHRRSDMHCPFLCSLMPSLLGCQHEHPCYTQKPCHSSRGVGTHVSASHSACLAARSSCIMGPPVWPLGPAQGPDLGQPRVVCGQQSQEFP